MKNAKQIIKMKQTYATNKNNKVGAVCTCPTCGTQFVKRQHQQAFCTTKSKTKCKDGYWNVVDPKKRNNTTRISPASNRWLALQADRRLSDGYDEFDPHDYEHPFSSEALGQW